MYQYGSSDESVSLSSHFFTGSYSVIQPCMQSLKHIFFTTNDMSEILFFCVIVDVTVRTQNIKCHINDIHISMAYSAKKHIKHFNTS